jgi:hypothetical protein
MAIVQGIRERLHLPIYDCLTVEPLKQLRDAESSSTLKFFVNVQNKTKLETNLQSASLLPTYNTFEARAMRVVLSDLPPVFPDDVTAEDEDFDVTAAFNNGDALVSLNAAGTGIIRQGETIGTESFDPTRQILASLSFGLDRIVELIREAAKPENEGSTTVDVNDDDVELTLRGNPSATVNADTVAAAGAEIILDEGTLRAMFDEVKDARKVPLDEQIKEETGAAAIMNRILYNTVTSLYVGEKVMIQMPTWFFPAGAGAYAGQGKSATNGMPSPSDTFRFAEPIFIERQQNFRVEIEVPDAETLKDIHRIYGPLFIWVVLDGYMTRGVQ